MPSLPTTMPAAQLATCIACGSAAPLPSIAASAAITVSPAPLTSNTSRAFAASCSTPLSWYRLMPSSLRVSSSACGAQLAPQRLRARGEVVLAFPASHHFAHFGAIGRNDGGAMVTRIVVALGIDQDDLAGRAREFDHFRDMGEPALAVIGQHQHIAAGQQRFEIRQLVRQYLMAGQGLEIDAQQLLLPADHAQLHRGGNARILEQAGDDFLRLDQFAQAHAGLVVADHRQQRRARAQRGRIARDVGGAARGAPRCARP